jgi:acetyl-CoA acetyltransferase
MLKNAFIPFKGYYSTPFCRWQGALSNENAIVLGGKTGARWLAHKNWDPDMFDYLILGITVGQPHHFYSSAWASALMGLGSKPGVSISQACTTGATCIYQAGTGVETDLYNTVCVLMVDRCSNAPHTVWPNPMGPGGEVISENWMIDNFNSDPNVGLRMVETAEKVAGKDGITKEECDSLTLRRYEQYEESLAQDGAFQKGFMFSPEVRISKKKTQLITEDEGITQTTKEGLAALKPVIEGGVLSFGSQTHPADANCAVVVTTEEKAKELSEDPSIPVQIVSYGYHRAEKGCMAAAPAPAAQAALNKAGIHISDVKAIKTHNPFIVNDLNFAKVMGIDPYGTESLGFNNYGSSLVYGHPQAPTAGRLIIEGIEEVAARGGGYFLWAGCAAGDTGGALVIKIG